MPRDQALATKPSSLSSADSKKIVVPLTQENFVSFVTEHRYTIVWASYDAESSLYPASLVSQLGLVHAPPVRLGLVRLSKMDWTPAVQLYVRLCLEKLKLKPDAKGWPPHGFYLLANGSPLGFHEGAVELDRDGDSFDLALGIGLLTALLTKDGTAGLTAGSQVAGLKAGERMAKAFAQLIQQHEATTS